MLPEGQDDEGCQQGAYRRTAVAAHLKDGLCQALLAARGQLGYPRGRGVEDGRAQSDHAHRQENEEIVLGESEQQQPHQGKAHAHRQGVGSWMLVGVEAGERLQDGGGHLKHQRDDAYLCKREVELVLHDGVDGGDDGLDHIVQEMGDAANDEHRVHRALHHRRVSLQLAAYGFNLHVLTFICKSTTLFSVGKIT